MCGSYEENDSKAGFYYDLKFVMGLLYFIFMVVFIVLSASVEFSIFTLIFLCVLVYLDLQEVIEVRVPRYSWKCSKSNYKIASALLIISLFLIPVGKCFLDSGVAVRLPFFLPLSLGLISIPMLLGMVFALTCYLDFGRSLGFWSKDAEIAKVFLKHSYFYRKIYGRKSAR